jgi:hypothetical protein
MKKVGFSSSFSFLFSIWTFVIRMSAHAIQIQFLRYLQVTRKKAGELFNFPFLMQHSFLWLDLKYSWNTSHDIKHEETEEKSFLITLKYFELFSRRRKSFFTLAVRKIKTITSTFFVALGLSQEEMLLCNHNAACTRHLTAFHVRSSSRQPVFS